MKVEDLVKNNLDKADKKLEILNEDKLTNFLDDYVSKELKEALNEGVAKMLDNKQKVLINRRNNDGEARVKTGAQVRELVQEMANRRDREHTKVKKRKEIDDDDDDGSESILKMTSKPVKTFRSKASTAQKQDIDTSHQKEDVKVSSRPHSRRQNQRNFSLMKDDKSEGEDESDADIILKNDDDDDDYDKRNNLEEKKHKKATPTATHKQAQLKRGKKATMTGHGNARKNRASLYVDSDDEQFGVSNGLDEDWGTADTNTER